MVMMKKKNNQKTKTSQQKKNGVVQEEDVNYAAAADAFADKDDVAEDDDDDDEEEEESSSEKESSSEVGGEEEEQDNIQQEVEESDDSENEESNDDENMEDEEEEESEEDDDDEEDDNVEVKNPAKFEQPQSATGEPCTFDLRNLVAMNTHQINTKALYAEKKRTNDASTTTAIPASQILANINVDEDELLENATDGCTQLVAALWQLPKERSAAGMMVHLPTFDDSRIPRALPPPEPKGETKWEKFARERGIPLNKEKRSQKVWDEATGTWMFRHGYKKANDESKEWPIMEVKDGEDPFANPWEKQREAKRSRVEKNVEQRMRNQERAGKLDKGTTTRVLKSRDKSRKTGMIGGNADRDSLPVGVPVDIKNSKSGDPTTHAKRGKVSTLAALEATQRSTASLGKFDKMREGEPERKRVNEKAKKRKYETATDRKVLSSETTRSLKVLKSVVEGGGVSKERDIRKGKFAKGETAYDYEFDDGLGPSSYRKKKGRAGVGKQKKMTKKRIK